MDVKEGGREDPCALAWPPVTRVVQSALSKELGWQDPRWPDSILQVLCGAIQGQTFSRYRSNCEKEEEEQGAGGCLEWEDVFPQHKDGVLVIHSPN